MSKKADNNNTAVHTLSQKFIDLFSKKDEELDERALLGFPLAHHTISAEDSSTVAIVNAAANDEAEEAAAKAAAKVNSDGSVDGSGEMKSIDRLTNFRLASNDVRDAVVATVEKTYDRLLDSGEALASKAAILFGTNKKDKKKRKQEKLAAAIAAANAGSTSAPIIQQYNINNQYNNNGNNHTIIHITSMAANAPQPLTTTPTTSSTQSILQSSSSSLLISSANSSSSSSPIKSLPPHLPFSPPPLPKSKPTLNVKQNSLPQPTNNTHFAVSSLSSSLSSLTSASVPSVHSSSFELDNLINNVPQPVPDPAMLSLLKKRNRALPAAPTTNNINLAANNNIIFANINSNTLPNVSPTFSSTSNSQPNMSIPNYQSAGNMLQSSNNNSIPALLSSQSWSSGSSASPSTLTSTQNPAPPILTSRPNRQVNQSNNQQNFFSVSNDILAPNSTTSTSSFNNHQLLSNPLQLHARYHSEGAFIVENDLEDIREEAQKLQKDQ